MHLTFQLLSFISSPYIIHYIGGVGCPEFLLMKYICWLENHCKQFQHGIRLKWYYLTQYFFLNLVRIDVDKEDFWNID